MRKLISMFACLLLLAHGAAAQYVDIPNSDFRTYLKFNYPSCFNAMDQMDTTCSDIVNEDSLTFEYTLTGSDITIIKYFKNLSYLSMTARGTDDTLQLPNTLVELQMFNSTVKYIASLPLSLRYLGLGYNQVLSFLPPLPENLEYLNLSACNQLPALPSLPPSLKTFICTDMYSFITLPSLPSSLEYLDCSTGRLKSLPALPEGLQSLICNTNEFTSLPTLPASLKYLNCTNNDSISSLPALPNGLLKLSCGGLYSGTLESLPALPGSLTYLFCGDTRIQTLPTLPANIDTMYCLRSLLTEVPALPSSLRLLNVYSNRLHSLPVLPSGLLFLDISQNPLYSITALPDSLRTLFCYDDSLTTLPVLPSRLKTLDCTRNQLTSLPDFPAELAWISCSKNELTSLPSPLPPGLISLSCGSNNIYCLPLLPPASTRPGLLTVDVDNKIKCLPNFADNLNLSVSDPVSGDQSFNSLPLCNPVNNVDHCQGFPVINGIAFYDNNLNGIKDNGELVKKNIKISLSNGSYSFTDENGYYEIGTDGTGNYSVAPAPPVYFTALPVQRNYNFTSYDTIVNGNFALQANSTIDSIAIRVTPLSWAARPGFPFSYFISYENTGTTTLNTNITFEYDNTRLIFDSSSSAGIVNNGNTLSFTESNFTPGQQGNYIGFFKLTTIVPLGDTINVKVVANANSFLVADSVSSIVGGSFDPNDKQATPQLSPSQVANGEYIDYTIRFQNTGTDTAFTVVISDTLSDELQTNTLQMIASSHNCKTTVKENIVFFEFLNILLPDSNVNEPKSHGFVSFKIKPQTTVAVNTTIPNIAAIYFDYNAPVITNTAGTLIKEFIVVPLRLVSFSAVPQTDNTTVLYWNTANEINTKHFVIEQSSDGIKFNSLKTVLAKGRANNNYSGNVVDVNNSLVYYRLKITDNDGSVSYSPILKIDRRKNTSGITVLTNPVKDFIIINTSDRSLSNTQCTIINTQGAVVKNFMVKQGSQTVEIKGLPPGIYYLQSINGSQKILIR